MITIKAQLAARGIMHESTYYRRLQRGMDRVQAMNHDMSHRPCRLCGVLFRPVQLPAAKFCCRAHAHTWHNQNYVRK